MSKFLKGNYEIDDHEAAAKEGADENFSEVFEEAALSRLGGSIAFVMKTDKFLWEEDEETE